MNENDFQDKLSQLLGQIDSLPDDQRSAMQQHVEATKERHERLRKTVKDLQDSLDYLRLSVKYLVFDLEATRRENTYLRKMLDHRNPSDQSGDLGSDPFDNR